MCQHLAYPNRDRSGFQIPLGYEQIAPVKPPAKYFALLSFAWRSLSPGWYQLTDSTAGLRQFTAPSDGRRSGAAGNLRSVGFQVCKRCYVPDTEEEVIGDQAIVEAASATRFVERCIIMRKYCRKMTFKFLRQLQTGRQAITRQIK